MRRRYVPSSYQAISDGYTISEYYCLGCKRTTLAKPLGPWVPDGEGNEKREVQCYSCAKKVEQKLKRKPDAS